MTNIVLPVALIVIVSADIEKKKKHFCEAKFPKLERLTTDSRVFIHRKSWATNFKLDRILADLLDS